MARRTSTFQCLSQPILMFGCERTPAVLVGGSAVMCAVMAWFSWSLLALAGAAFLFLIGIPFLQQLAKRDPRMVEIAFRFSAYQRHYPAQAAWEPDNRKMRVGIAGISTLVALALIVWWLFP